MNPFRKPKELSQPIDPKFSKILDLASSASNIWSDKKGNKNKRFREKGVELLEHLTLEVLSDPKFYQEVNWPSHIRILELLGGLFQKDPDELVEDRIVSYLRGVVSNRVAITVIGNDGPKIIADKESNDYDEKLAKHLRTFSGIPKDRLNSIYLRVGLPVNSNLSDWKMGK